MYSIHTLIKPVNSKNSVGMGMGTIIRNLMSMDMDMGMGMTFENVYENWYSTTPPEPALPPYSLLSSKGQWLVPRIEISGSDVVG